VFHQPRMGAVVCAHLAAPCPSQVLLWLEYVPVAFQKICLLQDAAKQHGRDTPSRWVVVLFLLPHAVARKADSSIVQGALCCGRRGCLSWIQISQHEWDQVREHGVGSQRSPSPLHLARMMLVSTTSLLTTFFPSMANFQIEVNELRPGYCRDRDSCNAMCQRNAGLLRR
jgi:hypothetical protein